jgi:hypothetical protein
LAPELHPLAFMTHKPGLPGCPACGHVHLHRSSPKSRCEVLLQRLTSVRFYRCHACMHRGWATRAVSQHELDDVVASRQLRGRRLATTARWALAAGAILAASIGAALAT